MDSQVNQKGVKSGGSICQRLVCKEAAENSSPNDDKFPYTTSRRSVESTAYALFEEFAPDSVTGNALVNSEAYVSDHGSLLSLQPWIFRKGECLRDDETMEANAECSIFCAQQMNGFMFNSQAEVSPHSVSLGYKHGRARSSLRSRRHHRNSVKPLSSMENCLIPQLYNDNFEIENFVSTSFPSSTTSPFVITDGSEIISKLNYEPITLDFASGIDKSGEKIFTGASPLPGLRTPKRKSRETPHKKLDSISTQRSKKLAHHEDSLARVHIFSIGVSLGIISTMLLNKNEIEILNGMLKSSENLVQDLQDELEMKETITVKELTSEVSGLLKRCDNITKCESIKPDANQVPASYFPVEKEKANSLPKLPMEESMSKIEAELEIELGKLELSMKACSLNGRMSALDELDPDLVADVVHGEIRADVLPGRVSDEQSENASNSSTSSTTEPQSFYCPVSPRQLSLRLHEVIQLRLEERIQDLEKELQETQKQLQLSKSDRFLSQKAFSTSDMGSSSNLDSPTSATGNTALAQPFCLKPTGDAVNGHDEAYEEFMRVVTIEEKQPSTTNWKNEFGYCVHSYDRSSIGEANEPEPLWEQKWKSKGSIDTPGILDEDEYDSDDDGDVNEMDMLLKQILERTKQGSPMVKDVHRLLFSMDD